MRDVESLLLPGSTPHSRVLTVAMVMTVTKFNAIMVCLTFAPAAILHLWLAFKKHRPDFSGTGSDMNR